MWLRDGKHCPVRNYDVFNPPFDIWVELPRNYSPQTHTHIKLNTPPPTPCDVSHFPQCCTAREIQDHCPNALWGNGEIKAFLQQSAPIWLPCIFPRKKTPAHCSSAKHFYWEQRTVKVRAKRHSHLINNGQKSWPFSVNALRHRRTDDELNFLVIRCFFTFSHLCQTVCRRNLTSLNLTLHPHLCYHWWLIINQSEQLLCAHAPEPAGVNHILFQRHFSWYTQTHLSPRSRLDQIKTFAHPVVLWRENIKAEQGSWIFIFGVLNIMVIVYFRGLRSLSWSLNGSFNASNVCLIKDHKQNILYQQKSLLPRSFK